MDDLVSVIAHYRSGTRFGIHVDPVDGLVAQGADGWALTWMDARIDTQAITPRIGKPVEINALWINGIAAVLNIMTASDHRRPDLEALHTFASASFLARFVRTDTPGLYDVIDAPCGPNVRDGNDASIRPNPDGTRMNYPVSGRGGPPLVFVYGWCSSLEHREAQLAHFDSATDRRSRLSDFQNGFGDPGVAGPACAPLALAMYGSQMIPGKAT